VAETTATNLLLVRGQRLITPAATCFLDGITKRHVMQLARQRGLSVEEGTVSLDELRAADEVFTAGTSVELQPVVALADGERITHWPVGPVTRSLIADFQRSVRGATQPAALVAH
jgi:branched-chain amino acid aminotransferase